MLVNNQPITNQRPLLVVLCKYAGGYEFPADHPPEYYRTNIFDLSESQTMNGFFRENSNGRFQWSKVGPGVVGPIQFTAQEGYVPTLARAGGDERLADQLYYSNMVARLMTDGGINFAALDSNQDAEITGDELSLLFILSEGPFAAAARSPGRVQPPGFTFAINLGLAAGVGFRTPFDTTTHEVAHTLGAFDLYGPSCLSSALTLMSCTSGTWDGLQTFHLDPWHKLKLGWCEPRILSLRNQSQEALTASQLMQPGGQVVLYDPLRGANEYFILEYRAANSPNGPGYDRNVAGSGLVIWHVKQGAPLPGGVPGVFSEGAPKLSRGGNLVWGSDSTTPPLRWVDGCLTPTRLRVQPFATAAGSITVDIMPIPELWLDFHFSGLPEAGTFDQPYNTLAEGVANIELGGLLSMKSGSTAETMTITKAMTMQACGGLVTLGRP
jgi:M6 family metalloprotease-like protein